MDRPIIFENVTQNNLKNISFSIERNSFTVVTGPSGSGKSSLVFDTVYVEGRRRFCESLSTYTRQFLEKFSRPSFETARNIPPVIALEQRNRVRSSRATVATRTEFYDLLMQLFTAEARGFCDCGGEIKEVTPGTIMEVGYENFAEKDVMVLFPKNPACEMGEYLRASFVKVFHNGKVLSAQENLGLKEALIVVDRLTLGKSSRTRFREALETAERWGRNRIIIQCDGEHGFSIGYSCIVCGKRYSHPSQSLFSFNSPRGACKVCRGFGNLIDYDMDLIMPERSKTIRSGAVDPFEKPAYLKWKKRLLFFCAGEEINADERIELMKEKDLERVKKKILEFFKQIENKSYRVQVRVFTSRYKNEFSCPACAGSRLRSEALRYKYRDHSIYDIVRKTVAQASILFRTTFPVERTSGDVNLRIQNLLGFLLNLGLSHLTFDRPLKTLSGGEFQRVRLAGYLSSGLTGTLYVLDEPTTGLHPRDTGQLTGLLRQLCEKGNTVLVVEQDLNVIEHSDYVMELGPGSGHEGGEIVFRGSSEGYLEKRCQTEKRKTRRDRGQRTKIIGEVSGSSRNLGFKGINVRNIKDMDLMVPLNRFVCLTGVSGSGKTTIVEEIIYPALKRILCGEIMKTGRFDSISGFKSLKGVVLINQNIPPRRARSAVATYLGIFDNVRKLYGSRVASRKAGLKAGHFSFNVDGGRCPLCKGEGQIVIDMSFLGTMRVICSECGGKRYKKNILGIRYNGKNVSEVLSMTVDEGLEFFQGKPLIIKKLLPLKRLGLGYLIFGMSLESLSGGELQRVKILRELQGKKETTFYIFDEPGIGLGAHEMHVLIDLFRALTERGHSVLCIEHDLNIIGQADHIIDLGPEGGENGGRIVFTGTPEDLIRAKCGYTGFFLKAFRERGYI